MKTRAEGAYGILKALGLKPPEAKSVDKSAERRFQNLTFNIT